MEDYPLDNNTLFPMIMKCPKCGKKIWEGTSACPCCGCDVNFYTVTKHIFNRPVEESEIRTEIMCVDPISQTPFGLYDLEKIITF